MNGKPNTEIEELLSAAVDDELSQRQQTELKRLLQHQPEIAEQLESLVRQRQLLCSMPIETAPPSLAADIQGSLERKLILDNASRTQSLRSRAALVRRRFVAAAAMLFLPLGFLGYVVFRIVTPTSDGGSGRPSAKELLKDDVLFTTSQMESFAVAPTFPFDGSLTLMTERPMLAAQTIEKQIFLKAMEHQTIPNRTAEVMTFQIECPADAMAELMGSLAPLWSRITDSRLTLRDVDLPEHAVTIEHIRPEQIQTLALQTAKMPMMAAARQYASSNIPLRPENGGNVEPMPDDLVMPKPFLAWPERETPQPQGGALPTVRLTIEVRQPE